MSDCNVCLGTDDFDFTWDFYNEKIVKARKDAVCCECDRPILKGQQYEYVSALGDGEMYAYKTCLDCADLRESLTCEGSGYTICHMLLWDEIREFLFPEMTTGCLQRIKRASAKEYLVQRWNEWKFSPRREKGSAAGRKGFGA